MLLGLVVTFFPFLHLLLGYARFYTNTSQKQTMPDFYDDMLTLLLKNLVSIFADLTTNYNRIAVVSKKFQKNRMRARILRLAKDQCPVIPTHTLIGIQMIKKVPFR